MARPQCRDAAKERFWRQAVGAWRASGLGVRDFCGRRRLSEPSFYGWRRELAQRDRQAARRPAAAFVPVQVVGATAAAIEIVRGDGPVVRVRPGFDAATLRQVLATLAEDGSC